jgi:oxygen-independent coproporphyrinogen III oxidase
VSNNHQASSLYIHIPFCKQRCTYCNFHFSTNSSYKERMLKAIQKELLLQKAPLGGLSSIYFGGGTPSLLTSKEIKDFLETINDYYKFSSSNIEITLEANPDDLNKEKLKGLHEAGINRLSIGIQSFNKEDLKFMNRAHNEKEALKCIKEAQEVGFSNLSIDLIYGSTSTTHKMWEKNLKIALELDVQHISAYCLTIEPKTPLDYQIKKGLSPLPNEKTQVEQYNILVEMLSKNRFIHYEISNFGKKNFFSFHNTHYWKNLPYLGIGPSAHSFDGKKRRWNLPNNHLYIKSIERGLSPPFGEEELTSFNKYNELIMIGLRTIWGAHLKEVKKIGDNYYQYLIKKLKKYEKEEVFILSNEFLRLHGAHWLYVDKIALDLFYLDK